MPWKKCKSCFGTGAVSKQEKKVKTEKSGKQVKNKEEFEVCPDCKGSGEVWKVSVLTSE